MQPSSSPSGQPTCVPTAMPSYVKEGWGQIVSDKKVHKRKAGMCPNKCSGHGHCVKNANCDCYLGLDGEPEWTGGDCSLRTCPKDIAWVGTVVGANDLHPVAECSNKGICNRLSGTCQCFDGYDGIACQRQACPNDCNARGVCFPERMLAEKAGRVYDKPWDASKTVGCVCDVGYRGVACDEEECPSGPDPLGGMGNETGRDCSGRGVCNYNIGVCRCFGGFFGDRCQKIVTEPTT
jgi:hypothetical protein